MSEISNRQPSAKELREELEMVDAMRLRDGDAIVTAAARLVLKHNLYVSAMALQVLHEAVAKFQPGRSLN